MESRPSPSHRLAIFIPMERRKPSLEWVNTKKAAHETVAYFNPDLDRLLCIPSSSNRSYIGRGLHRIRGNILRGREENKDTIDLWYLDPEVDMDGIITNQTLHSYPSPLHDTWGEKTWKGPVVITMREGNAFDPRLVKDVNLTAYRDAIDFLGFYRDSHGSMVDGIGKRTHLATKIMQQRTGKVLGWRLNCAYDEVLRSEPAIVSVEVPRAHPLLVYENDDPLQIPELLGFEWVARAYAPKRKVAAQLENKMAQLLLLRIEVKDDKWTGSRKEWNVPDIGSILLVHRWRGEIEEQEVLDICKLIEEVVLPLMTDDRARQPRAEAELAEVVKSEGRSRGLFTV